MASNSATASLKRTALFNGWANGIDPVCGNRFDMLLTADHESERVHRMSFAFGAVAGWFSTTAMGEDQRAWQRIVGSIEPRKQVAFTSL
jgi:hypothetical protein